MGNKMRRKAVVVNVEFFTLETEFGDYRFPVGFIEDVCKKEYYVFPLSPQNLAGFLDQLVSLLENKDGTLCILFNYSKKEFVKVRFSSSDEIIQKLVDKEFEEVSFINVNSNTKRLIASELRKLFHNKETWERFSSVRKKNDS